MATPFYVKYFIDDEAKDTILFERKNNVRRLILNRPEQLNSIDTPLLSRMLRLLKACEFTKEVKLVIMEGKGRSFCSGGDLKHLTKAFAGAPDPESAMRSLEMYSQIYEVHHLLGTMNKPVVTIMDGITYGAGTGLAAFSQFRIATENTRVAMPENSIGAFCDMGSSFFMPRLDAHLGIYMALTARSLKGEDAYLAGFATHFVPSARIEELKACLYEVTDSDLDLINSIIEEFAVGEDHKPANYTMHGKLLENINKWFRFDTVEEIVDALRKDGSEFALGTADTILSHSPTSLKITLDNYKRGKYMTIDECMRLETRIWHVVPFLPDFKRGINSKLVTKNKHAWSPSRLEDVDLEIDIRQKIIHAYAPVQFHTVYQRDYYERPINFTLPTEKEILEAQLVYGLDTVEKAVAWFKENSKGKKFGITEKVTDVLNRQKSQVARPVAKL